MIVTKSNVIEGVTPSVTSGASSDLPESVTDQDFSQNYTGTDPERLIIEFGVTSSINYVAVAGIILKSGISEKSTVRIADGDTLIKKVEISRDHCVVVSFPSQTFSNLKVTLRNAAANRAPTVSLVAAGEYLTIPNSGETSGYERAWINRATKNKTTVNDLAAPVGVLRKPIPQKIRLSLPDMTYDFSVTDWQDFLDFSNENLFFVNEDPEVPESSYCCFDQSRVSARAHSATRSLVNLSVSYQVFTGL